MALVPSTSITPLGFTVAVVEPVVEPVVEEKPPMPDMSDPNKTMSPDEIAALIANMS